MLTDEILVAQTMQGDLSGFEELVNRYQKPVFNIIYRLVGQQQEAEDLSQEVFWAVFHKLDQFDPSRKFSPWIQRIAVNTSISALRKRNRAFMVEYDDSFMSAEHIGGLDPGDPQLTLERSELRSAINRALRELPDNYRTILIMRYQLDLSNLEIAQYLGISKENVEVKIHRSRKALRRVLNHNCQAKE